MRKRRLLTGILSILITAVMLLSPCAIRAGEAEESERFGLVNWYSTYSAGSTIQDSFYYTDDWFMQDPEVQNDALALVSMQLTAAAVTDEENSTGIAFLKSLDFEQTGFCGFGKEDPEGCNFTWGTKTIGTGKDAFTLVAVAIQSYSLVQEDKQIGWKQNFLVNDETGSAEHASYAKAADYAVEEIAQLKINGNIKYWITGQSRGGAVAGVLAVRLKNDTNSVYAYTFEAPANVEQSAIKDQGQDYGYIHNYLCSDDIVTMIPPWDMTRYGVEHRLNTDETTQQLPEMLQKIGSEAASTAETYEMDTMERLSTGLIQNLTDRLPARESYSSLNTDIFADASGKEVSISYRYQDLFISLMQIVFGNAFEGVDFSFLADELPGLLPTISSLYQAVKEDNNADYYDAAYGFAAFLKKIGLELSLTSDDLYVLLKLAGPVMIDPDFVPEGDAISQDEMILCIAPVIDLFMKKDDFIFSHQFDTIIARLKLLAEEPAMENMELSLPEPSAGDDVASCAAQMESAFRDLGYSWCSAVADWETTDEQFQNNKAYYLTLCLASTGHSIPEGFTVTVNEEEPCVPLEICYTAGNTEIVGIWKYVFGTPEQISVSFDMEGHGQIPDPISVDTGALLKYELRFDSPEAITDDTGSYLFESWYDENGILLEDICAEADLVLYAKLLRMIDNIEISFDTPHFGEKVSAPRVPENADYEIPDVRIMDEKWDYVTEIHDMGEYTIYFEVYPVLEGQHFLTAVDEDGYDIYIGTLTVNGENTDIFYNSDENSISVSYSFTPTDERAD